MKARHSKRTAKKARASSETGSTEPVAAPRGQDEEALRRGGIRTHLEGIIAKIRLLHPDLSFNVDYVGLNTFRDRDLADFSERYDVSIEKDIIAILATADDRQHELKYELAAGKALVLRLSMVASRSEACNSGHVPTDHDVEFKVVFADLLQTERQLRALVQNMPAATLSRELFACLEGMNPLSYSDKQDVSALVMSVLKERGLLIRYKDQSCHLTVTSNDANPSGAFLLFPKGSKKPLLYRTHLADFLKELGHFQFDKSGLKSLPEQRNQSPKWRGHLNSSSTPGPDRDR